MKLFLPGKKYC